MSTTASTVTNTEEIDVDLEPVADETAQQAQLVVASYSTDAEECRMFLDMLGIGPKPVEPEDD